jgi:hypothetical protein
VVDGVDGNYNGKEWEINMACCGRSKPITQTFDVMGGYKYLSASQIKARLEIFKRIYCKNCGERYSCDFGKYQSCTIKPQVKSGG